MPVIKTTTLLALFVATAAAGQCNPGTTLVAHTDDACQLCVCGEDALWVCETVDDFICSGVRRSAIVTSASNETSSNSSNATASNTTNTTTTTPTPVQTKTETDSTPVPTDATETDSTPVPTDATETDSTPVPTNETETDSTPVATNETETDSTPVPTNETETDSTTEADSTPVPETDITKTAPTMETRTVSFSINFGVAPADLELPKFAKDGESLATAMKKVTRAKSLKTSEMCIGKNCMAPVTTSRSALTLNDERMMSASFEGVYDVESGVDDQAIVDSIIDAVKADLDSGDSFIQKSTTNTGAFENLTSEGISGSPIADPVGTTPTPSQGADDSDSGIGAGVIVGIVIAVIAVVAIVAGVVIFSGKKGSDTVSKV